jgi:hypothetical protein
MGQRDLGRSIIMSRYHLTDFRDRNLTPEYLAFLQQDFHVRQEDLKLVLRLLKTVLTLYQW